MKPWNDLPPRQREEMLMIRCPKCKRFVGNITYKINGFDDISDVRGTCKKHGRVEALWDDYCDIVPEES